MACAWGPSGSSWSREFCGDQLEAVTVFEGLLHRDRVFVGFPDEFYVGRALLPVGHDGLLGVVVLPRVYGCGFWPHVGELADDFLGPSVVPLWVGQ